MCLYVDRKVHETAYTPLKAHRDITCYKALIACYNTEGTEYLSPFYSKEWKIGEVQEATQIWNRKASIVEDGYFHTYSLHEDAKTLAHCLTAGYTAVVAKCIIPEGSEYYVGTDSECKPCYASRLLVVKEIVDYIHR